jgi:hypothetical protein
MDTSTRLEQLNQTNANVAKQERQSSTFYFDAQDGTPTEHRYWHKQTEAEATSLSSWEEKHCQTQRDGHQI